MLRSSLFRAAVVVTVLALIPVDGLLAAPLAAPDSRATVSDRGLLGRLGDLINNLWAAGGGGFDPVGRQAASRAPRSGGESVVGSSPTMRDSGGGPGRAAVRVPARGR